MLGQQFRMSLTDREVKEVKDIQKEDHSKTEILYEKEVKSLLKKDTLKRE
jgi:hypothetical protein